MKIELRDPTDLRPLPFVKAMVRWGKESDEFKGFCDDVRDNGIKHPLLITADGRVVDGETRRQAALAMQLAQVPCLTVPDDEVQEVIVRELVRRRNLTKGQLAYVVVPILEPAFLESLRRRAAGKRNLSDSVGKVEWCQLLGFSVDLLDQANRLHKHFDKHPEDREEWEVKIFAEKPVGIGAALAGIGGGKTDQSDREGKMAYTQMSLALERIGDNAEVWNDEKKRGDILEEWRNSATKIPAKIRKAIIEILQNA